MVKRRCLFAAALRRRNRVPLLRRLDLVPVKPGDHSVLGDPAVGAALDNIGNGGVLWHFR